MATATMFESGAYAFRSFYENKPHQTRWLGMFDPEMTGIEANRKLGHVGRLTQVAQDQFIKGWESERRLLSE